MGALKIAKDVKERRDNLYKAVWKAKSKGLNTEKYELRLFKLEKRYIERTFSIFLKKQELKHLKPYLSLIKL